MKSFRFFSVLSAHILGLAIMTSIASCESALRTVARSDRNNLRFEEGERWFNDWIDHPERIPVSFTYAGKTYRGLQGVTAWEKSRQETTEGTAVTLRCRLDEVVALRLEALLNAEFGEVEYTLWFENQGAEASAVLEDVQSVCLDFVGEKPRLTGCLGDHINYYAPYDKDLETGEVSFVSDSGRPTHESFPYFNLAYGDGGTLLALGWAGTWHSRFAYDGTQTSWTAGICNGFRSVLMPGEKVRTALVVMLPYFGRNEDDAANLWRDWFLKYNTPKADAAGTPIQPFSTTCFASDTGLPNSDGSVSERFYTWKRTLERLVYERLKIDFRWFDAGWYFDPAGLTIPKKWWHIGSWEVDTLKWPGKSLLESNEACHRAGMKVLTWFEPERVTQVEDLVRNYGYQKEWAIYNGRKVYTNNLGNPDCLEWTFGRITKMMGENGVDLFREDNNSDPAVAWPMHDEQEEEDYGLPRRGMTENKAVQGHYSLWDRIIDFCGKNGKCTYIDNCAAGGGRNDIESLRRSIPFLRSDADRTTTAMRLSVTSTFNKWIPFCGASTKESVDEQEAGKAGGSSFYVTRASWLPVYNMSEVWTHDVDLDYDRVRATYYEWQRFRHLLLKDFYVLSPWHAIQDDSGWTVFAWHDRDKDETLIQAFRQETCPEEEFVVRLPFLQQARNYRVEDLGCGEISEADRSSEGDASREISGATLSEEGLTIRLSGPKQSRILCINLQYEQR